MDCQDARERFSALLDGELGLTEWSETEAHVSRCGECGVILEKLHRRRRPDEPGRRRPPMAYVDEPSHWRGAIARLRRLRRSPVAFRLLVGAATIPMVLGIVSYTVSGRSALDVAARALVSWATSSSQADAPRAKPDPSQWPRERLTAARPDVSPSPGPSGAVDVMPARRAVTPSASPPAMPPAPSTARQGSTASAQVSQPTPAPSVTSTVKTQDKGVPIDPRADVVVQLSVQNRRVAEQGLTTLLSLLGGSTAGENRNSTIMAVIPRSSYEDFTRGLAQLGASQMETERASLPDPVHVAIRLAK
jgi:hypothetical protein